MSVLLAYVCIAGVYYLHCVYYLHMYVLLAYVCVLLVYVLLAYVCIAGYFIYICVYYLHMCVCVTCICFYYLQSFRLVDNVGDNKAIFILALKNYIFVRDKMRKHTTTS